MNTVLSVHGVSRTDARCYRELESDPTEVLAWCERFVGIWMGALVDEHRMTDEEAIDAARAIWRALPIELSEEEYERFMRPRTC